MAEAAMAEAAVIERTSKLDKVKAVLKELGARCYLETAKTGAIDTVIYMYGVPGKTDIVMTEDRDGDVEVYVPLVDTNSVDETLAALRVL